MITGLPQGFVRFGSAAHALLKTIHEHGKATREFLVYELDMDGNTVGMALSRLEKHGFVQRIGRIDPYVADARVQSIYRIWRPGKVRAAKSVTKSGRERTAKYRERINREKLKVSSIFGFRGKIPLERAVVGEHLQMAERKVLRKACQDSPVPGPFDVVRRPNR